MSYNEQYFEGRGNFEPKHQIEVNQWIMFFGIKPLSDVLDFGCGCGQRVHWFRMNSVNAIGVDKAEEAQEHAAGLSKGKINLKIPIKSYDFIFSVDVLEHIEDKELKNILSLLSKLSHQALYGITFVDDKNFSKDPTHINGKTKREWADLLAKYYRYVSPVPPWFLNDNMYLMCFTYPKVE